VYAVSLHDKHPTLPTEGFHLQASFLCCSLKKTPPLTTIGPTHFYYLLTFKRDASGLGGSYCFLEILKSLIGEGRRKVKMGK
jgi:hypothetical protein